VGAGCLGVSGVRSVTIDKGNYSAVDWGDGYFKYCEFDDFSIEGAIVSSDFLDCLFKGLDCYWGLFSYSNFIACRFTDCTFAGTAFPDTRFVDCSFVNCKFVKNNLDRECDFSKTIAYGCSLENCVGFKTFRVDDKSDVET
jgi:uncharacterized protein YjbI with pentapeptide repeats